MGVVSAGDNAPTRQAREFRDMLIVEIDQLLEEQQKVVEEELQAFNEAVRNAEIPAIFVD